MKIRDSDMLFFALLMTTLAFTVVWSDKPVKVGSKCKEFNPVDFNDTWFQKQGENGFHFPLSSKLQVTDGANVPHKKLDDDASLKLKNKTCWTIFTKVFMYTVPLQAVFKFDRMNQGKLEIRTEGTVAADVLKFYGDFTMVLTDNQNFALFYLCLSEMKEFWMLWVPVEMTEVIDEIKEKVLTHVHDELKLSRKEEDMANKKDQIRFIGAGTIDCAESAAVTKSLSEVAGQVPVGTGGLSEAAGRVPGGVPAAGDVASVGGVPDSEDMPGAGGIPPVPAVPPMGTVPPVPSVPPMAKMPPVPPVSSVGDVSDAGDVRSTSSSTKKGKGIIDKLLAILKL